MRRLLSLTVCVLLLAAPAPGHAQALSPDEPTRSLTDAELLDAVDLDRPELSAVKRAAASGDTAAALAALAEHFRTREDPALPDHPMIRRNPTPAEPGRVLDGGRWVVGVWHDFPGGEVDWLFNATEGRSDGVAFTREWTWQLNRMFHWSTWADAYLETGDERYPQAWAADLRGWRAQVPVEDARVGENRNAWRTIEAGSRLRSAPKGFYAFREALPDEAVLEYLHFVHDQADYLRKRSGVGRTPGNWEAIEMTGLYLASVLFPEFADSAAWEARAIDTFGLIADAAFYPDGAQKELTFGYGAATAGDLLFPVDVADRTGADTAFDRQAYLARVAPAYDWIARCTGPDGWTPWFNDKELHSEWRVRQALTAMPDRTDWLYAATGGDEGTEPEGLDFTFPWAGMHAMRSGWTHDDHLMVFENGPLGQAHQHQDKLNVVLWSHGQRLLYDNGGGPYQESLWRDWGLDTYSHNNVIVDGLAQRRSPKNPLEKFSQAEIDSGFEVRRGEPASTYAHGVYDGRWGDGGAFAYSRLAANSAEGLTQPVVHRRRVLHVKPDVFVVADEVTSADGEPHAAEARWHLKATEARHGGDAFPGVLTENEDRPNLQLIQLSAQAGRTTADSGVRGGHPRDLLGWDFLPKDEAQNAELPVTPALTVRHLAEEPADRITLLTVLAPVAAGGGPVVVAVEAGPGEGTHDLTMADGRRLRITHTFGEDLAVSTPDPEENAP